MACHTVVKGTGRGASCTASRISRTPLTAKNEAESQTPGEVEVDWVTRAAAALGGRGDYTLEWPGAGTLQVLPMTASKPASRRRAPRLSVERPGRVKGRLPHAITVIDLSLTGCLVRCGTLLKSGAILDFEMDLDDGPLSAKVRVADASVDGAASARRGPGAAWPAWSSWACRRGRTRACAVSWTRREGGAGVRTRPLAEVSARDLRPLLEEESEHWGAGAALGLRATSPSAVASGLERRALTGFVLQDGPRSVAYCYYMLDAGRAIVGSLFAAAGFRGQGLEESLLDAVLAEAQAHPGNDRVECQTLFSTAPAGGRPLRPRRLPEPRAPLPGAAARRPGGACPSTAGSCGRCAARTSPPPPTSSTPATAAASTPPST